MIGKPKKYDYNEIVDFLKQNGPSTARQIGVSLFGMPSRTAASRAGSVMKIMEKHRLVRRIPHGHRYWKWECTGYGIESQPQDRCNMFKKDFSPKHKPCYMGPRGFVHVFNPGEYTCNCGERTGEIMEGKYVGDSFLYGSPTKMKGKTNYAD